MASELDLRGKAVLVTGAVGGIGAATAIRFTNEGASVAILDRNGNLADRTAKAATAVGVRARAIVADVSSTADVARAVAEAEGELGLLSVLLNNAGIAERRPFLELPVESWRTVLDVNLTGAFLGTQAVVRRMVAHTIAGAIVSVASVARLTGVLNRSAYAAAKHGLIGLTRTLALELAPFGTRDNVVVPVGVATDLTADLRCAPDAEARIRASHPLGRAARKHLLAVALAVSTPATAASSLA